MDKFTDEQRREIVRMYRCGVTPSKIKEKFGCDISYPVHLDKRADSRSWGKGLKGKSK